MTITIIGIDCATQSKNLGLALGHFHNDGGRLEQVLTGSLERSATNTIANWMRLNTTTLLALDSPLGWPIDLGESLYAHEAGQPIYREANQLFRRLTDRMVKVETGKQPLDVGADRIARTAHWTLGLLQELREKTGESIALAWNSSLQAQTYAIEVYPAATLAAYGVKSSGYKKKEGVAARKKLVDFLQNHLHFAKDVTDLMEWNDHVLDAVICVLAGLDFLRGQVMPPPDFAVAKKEGWIWVKKSP